MTAYLDGLVPATRYNDGLSDIGGEPHAGNPVRVAILLNGEFALSQSVPELDGVISGAGNNLTVVSRESNAQDILIIRSKKHHIIK